MKFFVGFAQFIRMETLGVSRSIYNFIMARTAPKHLII